MTQCQNPMTQCGNRTEVARACRQIRSLTAAVKLADRGGAPRLMTRKKDWAPRINRLVAKLIDNRILLDPAIEDAMRDLKDVRPLDVGAALLFLERSSTTEDAVESLLNQLTSRLGSLSVDQMCKVIASLLFDNLMAQKHKWEIVRGPPNS